MRSQPEPHCLICGSNGHKKYGVMSDRLFGAMGEWTLVECANRDCGVLWLDPMPIAEDIHEAYLDYYTHALASTNSWLRQAYYDVRNAYLSHRFGYGGKPPTVVHRLLARLVRAVPHLRVRFDASVMWLTANIGGRLLEIGCGRGDMLWNLKNLGWRAEGIDVDPQAVAVARQRGLIVREESLENMHYEAETFDAVIMSHVIEHLHDPTKVLKECYRVLKSGGRLIVLTPNTESFGHKLYGRHWLHLDPPRHLHLFNMTTLPKLAQGLAFSKTGCFSVIRDANWTLGASQKIKRTGQYKMAQLRLRTKLLGYVLMYIEWLAWLFDKRMGEEIVFMAEK